MRKILLWAASAVVYSGMVGVSVAQEMLCHNGAGSFEFNFSGITLRAGASRSQGLANRNCEASLSWNKDHLIVATGVSTIDVEAAGIDLGLGKAVAAFQVKSADSDCCATYSIYSLAKPPRLLGTIKGAQSFRSQDTDLDGLVEIWADDAAAFNGFDGLNLVEFDSPPPLVLRYTRGQLWDVSAEFQYDFDKEIAQHETELTTSDLHDFKSSDGKLGSGSLPADRLHHLRGVKAKILEIVWSYLYSGREQKAWSRLAEMWPAGDVDRIREALVNARARGIIRQTSGSVSAQAGRKRRAPIFDSTAQPGAFDFTPPEAIVITRPSPESGGAPALSALMNLVIDSAGKVRSAEAAGNGSVDPALIQATSDWKFVPAMKSGRPVACRIRLSVAALQ